MKKEIRVVGIDDAPFNKFTDKKVILVATIFRGGKYLDGVLSATIDVDGDNATSVITQMLLNSKHHDQLRAIFLDGIAFGGFNVVDIDQLRQDTRMPVITIMRKKPDVQRIEQALRNVENAEHKLTKMLKAGNIKKITIKNHELYIQHAGISLEEAKELLTMTCTRAKIPEPIRVAHLIASGITTGESKGHA